jgi:hypothetical protein
VQSIRVLPPGFRAAGPVRAQRRVCMRTAEVAIGGVPFWKVDLLIYVYQLNDEGAAGPLSCSLSLLFLLISRGGCACVDEMAGSGEENDDTVACRQWVLPSKEFDGLWPK